MRIDAIGTAGGKTIDHRLTTFLVDDVLSLDAGSVCTGLGLEQQLKIENLFLSHVHMDHVGELPLLVDNLSLHGKSLTVHATEATIEFLKSSIFNGVIWPDFTRIPDPQSPTLRFREVRYMDPVEIDGFTVTALPVNHLTGSAGCHVMKDGKGLVYTSDTGETEEIWSYINARNDVQAVITECSFPADMEPLAVISRHYSSVSLEKELLKLKVPLQVYIYHLKPQFRDRILAEIDHLNVTVLKDGTAFQI